MSVGIARGVLAAALVGLLSSAAAAQSQTEAEKHTAARTLAEQGDEFWDLGNYLEARDRFARAFTLVSAPTLAFREAECLEKLGRLVEAADRFASVGRMTVSSGDPEAFREAVSEAGQRLRAVESRLPRLQVTVAGRFLGTARLTLDGQDIPRALWGVPFPVDPGTHRVALVRLRATATKTVTLAESERKTVEISFEVLKEGVAEPGVEEDDGELPVDEPPPAEPPVYHDTWAPVETSGGDSADRPKAAAIRPSVESPGSLQRALGWSSIAVGAVGVGVGTATGIVLLQRKSEFAEECPNQTCPPGMSGVVDGSNRLRTISTLAYAVGLVGTGAGLYLLLTGPEPNPRKRQGGAVHAWMGLGQAGMTGVF